MQLLLVGFELFGIVFSLIFLLAFGIIIFVICRGVTQWNRNNRSPVLTVDALVVSKRTQVITHHHNAGNGGMHTSQRTSCFVTFQVESGDRMELSVGGRDYGMLAEGDRGRLTFQGTRYLGFERGKDPSVEKIG